MDILVGALGSYDFAPKLPAIKTEAAPENNPFKTFYNAAMDVLNETNLTQLDAEQWQTDLASGKTDDVLAVLLAQDRSFVSLNFTVQVTNKIIESYREIMRMQI